MGETTRTVDLNAHVNNIECQIETANNIAKAVIAFDNLGYGTITAIKFIAQGFNSFGDAVKVNGQDKFFLIIQDISIEKNCHAENLRATLPNGDIRKLILEESQICYADGTVSTYSGRNDCSFTLQTIEEDDIEAVRDEYNDQFEYMPIELDAAWVCGCGRCNGRDEAVCSNCGSEKEHVLQLSTPDYISELKVKHEAKEQERKEQAAAEEAQKAKARKKRIIKIGSICVAVAIYIVFNWNINILSNRTTYNSAAEMKTALQGTYTHYYMGETVSQLVISGDKATWVFNDGQTIEKDIEKWNYKRGIVRTSESPLVVNKAGNLERGNTVYKKGQFKTPTSKKSTSTKAYESAESGFSVLQVSDVKVSYNSSYTVCTGSVKNTGKKTYTFIEVKGAFKDYSGTVLDTDWTYVVGSEGLAPNESSTFRMSIPKNFDVTSCTVSVYDYD